MIAKLQSISYLSNALNYCDRGGTLLHTNQCFGGTSDINLQMVKHNRFNDKCLKNTFHVKIRMGNEPMDPNTRFPFKGMPTMLNLYN